uniref:LRRNT domain-containing protein n=1 Tax=Electrophorus electricus TaxID=8005 RepID=A0A4W4GMP2_ELEEL
MSLLSAATSDLDYGGVPLWINRFRGERSVFTLRECDCPIQWPTALYCEHRGLGRLPAGLPSRTEYLFLQGNMINGFGSGVFTNATILRWLFLDRNQLLSKKLDRMPLSSLTRFVNLFINHNNLTEVPAGLPSTLRQLRLAYNHIEKISSGTFQNLTNLNLLLLQGNQLKTLGENDFKGLSILNLMDLSHNHLDTFPKHLPPSVQQLYLSGNVLTGMSSDSLQGFSGLHYLRLNHNQLKSEVLHPSTFNVTSLVELDLSYNQLTQIPVVPTTLQYLYLEVNNIGEFNVSSLCQTVGPMSYSHMKILRLDGNKMAEYQMPPDWVYCLRVIHNFYI